MPKYGDKKKVVSKLQVPQLEEIREVPHNSYSGDREKKKEEEKKRQKNFPLNDCKKIQIKTTLDEYTNTQLAFQNKPWESPRA